jgi:hypothetical protein
MMCEHRQYGERPYSIEFREVRTSLLCDHPIAVDPMPGYLRCRNGHGLVPVVSVIDATCTGTHTCD